jgi:hypothetical protein
MTYPLVDSRHSVVGWFLSRADETAFHFSVDIHSNISLEENQLVLSSGRIMFANKLQKSGKSLQNRQRANRMGTGTMKISLRS